jgi:hypothetical protein
VVSYNCTSFSPNLGYSIDLRQKSHGHNTRTFIINQQRGIFNKNQTKKESKNKLYSTKPKDLVQKHCTQTKKNKNTVQPAQQEQDKKENRHIINQTK